MTSLKLSNGVVIQASVSDTGLILPDSEEHPATVYHPHQAAIKQVMPSTVDCIDPAALRRLRDECQVVVTSDDPRVADWMD